jgi:hypothetical protein
LWPSGTVRSSRGRSGDRRCCGISRCRQCRQGRENTRKHRYQRPFHSVPLHRVFMRRRTFFTNREPLGPIVVRGPPSVNSANHRGSPGVRIMQESSYTRQRIGWRRLIRNGSRPEGIDPERENPNQ